MLESKFLVLEHTDCRYPSVPIEEISLLPLNLETVDQEDDLRPNVRRGHTGQARAEVSWIWSTDSRPLKDSLEDVDPRLQAI